MQAHPNSFSKGSGWLLTALLSLLLISSAHAQILWYNGDYDHQSGLINTDVTWAGVDGITYDDFNVTVTPGLSVWDVQGIYGTFLLTTDATTSNALWEIRTGVFEGNGGMIVASGVSPVTVAQIGTDRGYNVDTVSITGLDVVLSPGTYWVGLEPTTATAGYGYLVTTQGANAIGTPPGNDGEAFYTSAYYGYDFADTANLAGHGHDFSMGVTGIATVPEPSTWLLLICGCAGLGLWGRRAGDRHPE